MEVSDIRLQSSIYNQRSLKKVNNIDDQRTVINKWVLS